MKLVQKYLRNKRLIILSSIIILAATLRLFNLSSVPPSASLDESSIGYNAYSVLKTGVDEFGSFPLISQRGYDDWRRSTYLLMVVPSVAVLGLNSFAVRIPSVVLSILTVFALYYIVLEIFKKKDETAYYAAYLSSFLLAISPWHIYISRIGHESNACLSFLVFAVYFFLKGRKSAVHFFIAAIFFLLSLISYYTGQIFVPLFGLILLVFFGKEIIKNILSSRINLLVSIFLVALTILVLWSVFSPESLIRYRGTSTLSQEAHSKEFAERVELRNKAVKSGDFVGTIVYNRHLFFVQVLLDGYISHFKPEWLFTNPHSDSFKAPHSGLLYLWQMPFILAGIYFLIRVKNIQRNVKTLIFFWLILGPLPASIATQAPHAMRAYNIVPVYQIFIAFGFLFFINAFGKYKKAFYALTSLIAIFSLWHFSLNYFVIFPKEQSKSFQYAFSQSVPFILKNQGSYKKIVFSNEDNLYQSYMIFLFHSKYDPFLYQKQGGTVSGGYKEVHTFDQYEFRPILWNKEVKKGTLFIGNPKDIPKDKATLFESKYLDGSIGVRISGIK